MPFPPPDKQKRYALLTKAMLLRSESYSHQADAIVFDDARSDEEKRIEIGRLLDLADDYRRVAAEFASIGRTEEKRIVVVPAIGGLRT